MKTIKKIYIGLGRIAYVMAIPLMWGLLNRRVRSYVFIEQDARVLLVRNWLSNGEWGLPGGGSHANETPLQAAIREVREELQIELSATKMLFLKEGFNKRLIGGKHYVLFYFILPAGSEVRAHKLELVDITWLPLPSLRSTPGLSPEVIAALEARPA